MSTLMERKVSSNGILKELPMLSSASKQTIFACLNFSFTLNCLLSKCCVLVRLFMFVINLFFVVCVLFACYIHLTFTLKQLVRILFFCLLSISCFNSIHILCSNIINLFVVVYLAFHWWFSFYFKRLAVFYRKILMNKTISIKFMCFFHLISMKISPVKSKILQNAKNCRSEPKKTSFFWGTDRFRLIFTRNRAKNVHFSVRISFQFQRSEIDLTYVHVIDT